MTKEEDMKVIIFFGDSLTDGYILGKDASYPAIVERHLNKVGSPYRVVNAGISGETTADGLRRIESVLNEEIEIFFLALGTNDLLRGVSLNEMRENLQSIISKVQERYPPCKIVVAGVSGLETDYPDAEIQAMYKQLATKNNASLLPSLLEGVVGIPEFNLSDMLHPNERGHKIMADQVISHLNL